MVNKCKNKNWIAKYNSKQVKEAPEGDGKCDISRFPEKLCLS